MQRRIRMPFLGRCTGATLQHRDRSRKARHGVRGLGGVGDSALMVAGTTRAGERANSTVAGSHHPGEERKSTDRTTEPSRKPSGSRVAG